MVSRIPLIALTFQFLLHTSLADRPTFNVTSALNTSNPGFDPSTCQSLTHTNVWDDSTFSDLNADDSVANSNPDLQDEKRDITLLRPKFPCYTIGHVEFPVSKWHRRYRTRKVTLKSSVTYYISWRFDRSVNVFMYSKPPIVWRRLAPTASQDDAKIEFDTDMSVEFTIFDEKGHRVPKGEIALYLVPSKRSISFAQLGSVRPR